MPETVVKALHLLGLLGVATVCSAIIGFDRERKSRPAGLRTHIIVCVSSTLVMFTGIVLKDMYMSSSPNIDPARLAAQILSGIGFLGAGTIIKGKDNVHGLTTAATLWSVACIGIAIGAGLIIEGVVATLVVLLVLQVISKLEKVLLDSRRVFELMIKFSGPLSNLSEVNKILASNKYRMISSRILYDNQEEDSGEVLFTAQIQARSVAGDMKLQDPPDQLLERFTFIKEIEMS
jgi:putative Mg2+ transporter-C (MgtC) family protein